MMLTPMKIVLIKPTIQRKHIVFLVLGAAAQLLALVRSACLRVIVFHELHISIVMILLLLQLESLLYVEPRHLHLVLNLYCIVNCL